MPAAYVISTTGRLLQGTSTRTRRLWLGGLFTLALVPLLGVMLRAPSATDLGRGHAIEAAGVLAEWAQGNVMVVIRHAERCDRSQNQCLGDATGITIEGTRVAAVAGQALEAMGLEDTDFVTSPLLRTVQTSQAITGRKVTPVEWLQACEAPPYKICWR